MQLNNRREKLQIRAASGITSVQSGADSTKQSFRKNTYSCNARNFIGADWGQFNKTIVWKKTRDPELGQNGASLLSLH
jgi:hypothetical protein